MTFRRTKDLGYVIDCKGAWLRPHVGATAVRLIVSGQVDGQNCGVVRTNLHRFLKLGEPLILDLEGAVFARDEARTLLGGFSTECAHHFIPWAAVLDHRTRRSVGGGCADTPVFHRIAEALAHLAESTIATEQAARVVATGSHENRPLRAPFRYPGPPLDDAATDRSDRADRIRKLTIC
ncbi:hypothetical protein PDG61_22025 [Mycolicibacterium sp. BiH015]|uniref:hypothetical protein n=1 Tax=Mycolicibacterium sp. BiH015 TaxID=3018808 RepID=UPI0022E215AB|nr:hypothetical protein [Mycolicibacterium sp. BiH015]MDA2893610.1 hypothetical protein [Mycolicibacterium sp. BiH015]